MNPQGVPLILAEHAIRLYHPYSKADPECDQSMPAAPPSVLRREHHIRSRLASAAIPAQWWKEKLSCTATTVHSLHGGIKGIFCALFPELRPCLMVIAPMRQRKVFFAMRHAVSDPWKLSVLSFGSTYSTPSRRFRYRFHKHKMTESRIFLQVKMRELLPCRRMVQRSKLSAINRFRRVFRFRFGIVQCMTHLQTHSRLQRNSNIHHAIIKYHQKTIWPGHLWRGIQRKLTLCLVFGTFSGRHVFLIFRGNT